MRQQRGFSLMEILIALTIMAILAAVVIQNLGGEVSKAQYVKLRSDFQTFESALMRYYNDNGFYPTTEQGLEALVDRPETNPEPRTYPKGGYISSLKNDPWNNAYLYLQPAEYGDEEYEILSLGGDGQEGGEGQAADVANWNIDEVLDAMNEQQ